MIKGTTRKARMKQIRDKKKREEEKSEIGDKGWR